MSIFSKKKGADNDNRGLPDVPVVPKPLKPAQPKKVEQAHEHDVLDSVEQSNKDRNEALVGDGPSEGTFFPEPHRKKGETQQEYNSRVPVGVQPAQPGPTHSYLGEKL